MTQQYLVGELSLILGELHAVATNEAAVRDIARLRQEAETTLPTALAPVVERAVELTNRVCWDTLERRDVSTFVREVAICAEDSGWCRFAEPVYHCRGCGQTPRTNSGSTFRAHVRDARLRLPLERLVRVVPFSVKHPFGLKRLPVRVHLLRFEA